MYSVDNEEMSMRRIMEIWVFPMYARVHRYHIIADTSNRVERHVLFLGIDNDDDDDDNNNTTKRATIKKYPYIIILLVLTPNIIFIIRCSVGTIIDHRG